jgi:hypothetical protein
MIILFTLSICCFIAALILALKLKTDVDTTRFIDKPSVRDWLLRDDSCKYSLYRV